MGQRLVINVYCCVCNFKNNEFVSEDEILVANAYYHWGGYNETAHVYLSEIRSFLESEYAQRICSDIINGDNKHNFPIIKELAIRMLEYTGAGLNIKARKVFEEDVKEGKCPNWEIQDAVDRNEGLLEINEERMKENQDWSEFDLNLYLDINNLAEMDVGGDIQFEYGEERRKHIHTTRVNEENDRSSSSFGYDKDGKFCKLS